MQPAPVEAADVIPQSRGRPRADSGPETGDGTGPSPADVRAIEFLAAGAGRRHRVSSPFDEEPTQPVRR